MKNAACDKIIQQFNFVETSSVSHKSESENVRVSQKNKTSNQIKQYAASLPKRFQGLFKRTVNGSASPRQTIKAKCHDCVGYEDATLRIRCCNSLRCPLWKYRPYQFVEKV